MNILRFRGGVKLELWFGSRLVLHAGLILVKKNNLNKTLPSFSSVLAKRTGARDNHVLVCNFARYSPILIFSLSDSTINLS